MAWFNIFNRGEASLDFAKQHKIGFLKVPNNLKSLPKLGAIQNFVAPNTIDERPRCTKTEDQGSKPWCAAYAATQFAENILWRKNGYVDEIDPARIYSYAKTIDGDPNGDGTSIPAVFNGLTHYGYFNAAHCPVKIINNNISDVRYVLHKFGVFLGGFMVTREWYQCNKNKTAICSKYMMQGLGGHCVLVCGYNKDGVYILNSWGKDWGEYGYALITWRCFQEQFMYGGIINNCLDGIEMK